MRVLREEGHGLGRLLECAGMARSSYYYALSHPKAPTRPELWEAAAEIFSRTANGCVSSRGFEQKEHRKLSSRSIGSAHAF